MDSWNWYVVDEEIVDKCAKRCRERNIVLPTFAELQKPHLISGHIKNKLKKTGLQDDDPLNLFRINWCNDINTGEFGDINFLEIPSEISGVSARIIGLVGKYFPTGAHKVGATYGCLAPYLVTGKFNPEYHKAVWPSTGNYCRGGAFNSNLLGIDAVAILPEEMSRERFDWLKKQGAEIYATPGCESNVKEIYDKCHELSAQSDRYFIFNQFDQFGNSVWHYHVTGYTIETLFNQVKEKNQKLSAYVSATGSAGTIAAGDYLRRIYPEMKVVASEALQCPTLLLNGFGGHRIEGIGDKHVPWIHNVKNTDAVCAINDEDAMRILRLFNEPAGKTFFTEKGIQNTIIENLNVMGISGIANLLASIKYAKYFELNKNNIVFTIFTDSVDLYESRLKEMREWYGDYSKGQAAVDWDSVIKNQGIDYFKELLYYDKKTIHNLKYFTWIEQQGKDVEELNEQWYDEDYWPQRFEIYSVWDKHIKTFNKKVGLMNE